MFALRRCGTAIALATLGSMLAGAPAHAATAKPVPCGNDYLFDDAGDAFWDPGFGLAATTRRAGHPAAANADITKLFFTYGKDSRGFNAVFANVQVADLSTTPPPLTDSQNGLYWHVVYLYNGATYFVRGRLDAIDGTVTWSYGTIDSNGTFTNSGSTTGTLFKGKQGVVQIRIPPQAGGRLGQELVGGMATSDYLIGINLLNTVDEAPDGASVLSPAGLDYKVAACTR